MAVRPKKYLTTEEVIEGVFADRDSKMSTYKISMSQNQKRKQKLKKYRKRKNLENKLLTMPDKKVTIQTCKVISGEEWLQ